MRNLISANSGIYLLELFIDNPGLIASDRFNKFKLNAGYYYYCGSAQKNLKSRIRRHLSLNKKIHWHIDHFTTGTKFIERIWVFENAEREMECRLADFLENRLKFTHPIKNFGNGDCTSGCISHLLFSQTKLDQSHLFSLYQSIVCLMPSSSDISWE